MLLPRVTSSRPPHETHVCAARSLALLVGAALVMLATSACASGRAAGRGGASGAPASFMRLAPESQMRRTIGVRDGLGKSNAYRTALDYLASKQYDVEARDQSAGFVMTGWQASLQREGVPDLRYRSRVILKFLGEEWRQLEVRAEANWRAGDEWQVGVDRELLDQVTAELRARLGKP